MNHPSNGDFWDDDDEPDEREPPSEPIPKPDALLRLHGVTAELFEILKDWFDVPDRVGLDLEEVDSAVAELGDPQMIIALAMRKLQALHLLATPGVRTATDVVVAIVNDLERAMVQAPNMWLKRLAATTDWDDELAAFTESMSDPTDRGYRAGTEVRDDDDALIVRFRELHSLLHDAMFAVIEAGGGEIRELE